MTHLSCCDRNKTTHASSLSQLAAIRQRTAEKLRGGARRQGASSTAGRSRIPPHEPSSTAAAGTPDPDRSSKRRLILEPALWWYECMPASGPPVAAERPGARIQRPKSAGAVRRSTTTPRQSLGTSQSASANQTGEPALSRREQIALKKQQDAALDISNRKSPRPTSLTVWDSHSHPHCGGLTDCFCSHVA